jgi:hypothetical protein
MSDKEGLGRRMFPFLLAAVSIAFLVVVWLSRPEGSGEFPRAMQDGLGLLLAALVFVLGFAREAQQRISAAALEAFRRYHDGLLEAWTSRGDLHLNNCELMNLALRRRADAGGFSLLAGATMSKKTRRLVALSAQREAIYAEAAQLEFLLEYRQEVVRHAQLHAANPDYEVPDFYRPKSEAHLEKMQDQIPKIEKDLAGVEEKRRDLNEAGGAGTAELVTGPTRIRLATTTYFLMLNAHRFVTGMALLYVAGIIYAGPSLELLGSPELWVATLVMVVALTYVRLVTRDVRNDLVFTAESVDRLPLFALMQMDFALAAPDSLSADKAIELAVQYWRSSGWWLLRHIEVQAPGLTWTHSVRGRFELALALHSGTHWDRQRRERDRYLRLAEQDLQLATDDPLALVALARTREEMGDPDAAGSAIRTAIELLERVRPWRAGDGWDRTLTVTDLLDNQRWLWPQLDDAVDLLAGATVGRQDDEIDVDGGDEGRGR